jgi:photosystem I subunit 11
MTINKAEKFPLFDTEEISTGSSPYKNFNSSFDSKGYAVVSSFQGDPFVGHLSTPITTSNLTRSYLSLLPAYKSGLSPLLRGINIGFVHGYFLLGPFVKLGPLRNSEVANFVGFVSTLSLITILTTCLLIYGYVTFSETKEKGSSKKSLVDFLNSTGWTQFSSGFIVGGFGGSSIAYVLLRIIPLDIVSF